MFRPIGRILAIMALVAGISSASVPTASAAGAPGAEFAFGPAIGAKIEFESLTDRDNAPRDLASLTGENGLVLMFYRSADWCPYCQAQLIEMNSGLAEIERRGYRLAAVSYDSPEILAAFTERRNIGYVLLSDRGSELINKYGLRETRYEEGHRAFGVPKPIVFVLGGDGTIKSKLFEEDYRVRPPVAAVVEALDRLSGE